MIRTGIRIRITIGVGVGNIEPESRYFRRKKERIKKKKHTQTDGAEEINEASLMEDKDTLLPLLIEDKEYKIQLTRYRDKG